MTTELISCPFCGGTVKMNVNAGDPKKPHGFITCNKCNICFTLYHSHDPDKISAAWNRRPDKKTILLFVFETGDASCKHYEVYVSVESEDVDYNSLEDSVSSYMESDYGDKEYDDIVEDIMNGSGLSWALMSGDVPESKDIHIFWI